MSDSAYESYRAFVRGGISAVITLNSGAILAVLTQLSDLLAMGDASLILKAFVWWIGGVCFGALCWALAAVSAICYANDQKNTEAFCVLIGFLFFFASLSMFMYGTNLLIRAVIA